LKIAVVSDLHGNVAAFRAIVSRLDDIQHVLFLGDVAGYYRFVEPCLLMWDERFVGVLGNHDQVLLQCLANGTVDPSYEKRYGSALGRCVRDLSPRSIGILKSLPTQRSFQLDGVGIVMFHGSPSNPLEGRVYPDHRDWSEFANRPEDIILLGHTHYAFIRKCGDKLVVNPGSVGQPRDRSGAACFAILDVAAREAELMRVPFDASPLIADSRRHNPDLPYLAEVLTR
jgi:putative phosphoesterase